MPQFQVRYKPDAAPRDVEGDVVVVEAAMFQTDGDFIDFYSDATPNVGGRLNAKGQVVFRVSAEIVADIRQNT